MSHTLSHWVILLLGQLTGWLAFGIGFWLEYISARECKPEHSFGFLLFGAVMIWIHSGIVDFGVALEGWLPALGYFVLIGGVLWAGRLVVKHSDIEEPSDTIADAVETIKR